MAEPGEPISYMALQPGADVVTAAGTEIGRVEHVLQEPDLDLFDGLAVKTHHGLRFVDRDQITDITTTVVRTSLSDDEAAQLPAPHGSLVLHVDVANDEGRGLSAWYGRLFGRTRWKELE